MRPETLVFIGNNLTGRWQSTCRRRPDGRGLAPGGGHPRSDHFRCDDAGPRRFSDVVTSTIGSGNAPDTGCHADGEGNHRRYRHGSWIGADDYLAKPFDMTELLARSLEDRASNCANRPDAPGSADGLLGCAHIFGWKPPVSLSGRSVVGGQAAWSATRQARVMLTLVIALWSRSFSIC
jgi:hypothetical protein